MEQLPQRKAHFVVGGNRNPHLQLTRQPPKQFYAVLRASNVGEGGLWTKAMDRLSHQQLVGEAACVYVDVVE